MTEETFRGPADTIPIKLLMVAIFILMNAFYLLSGPKKSAIDIIMALVAFLIFVVVVYVLIWKLSKDAGQLEANSYQIVIREHEIEAFLRGKHFITLNAEEISELKLGFFMLKFKPKDYRRIMQAYEIDVDSLKAYERNRPWMGIKIPKLKKADRKRLGHTIEVFKANNG